MLSIQFQQRGLANGDAAPLTELAATGVVGDEQMMSNAPSVGAQQPDSGGTPTDLQQQQFQQQTMVAQPQQAAMFYQPQPPTYYGPMPHYMPAAANAATTGAAGANTPYQQPLFLYPVEIQ